jgi:hypothetical protein
MPGRTTAYLGLIFFTSGQAADKKKGPQVADPIQE